MELETSVNNICPHFDLSFELSVEEKSAFWWDYSVHKLLEKIELCSPHKSSKSMQHIHKGSFSH